jgi:4-amino-4-deoxy-L-arabinose transferase-like glycosyltransferase
VKRWGLVSVCFLAFALRLIGLEAQSLWRDEVDAIRFAGQPLAELVQTFAAPGENGPLYYLVLRPWLEMAGDSAFALRFFSVAWGVLAVALTYRLARRLLPRLPAAALLAALLAAVSPYLVWYSQEGKMYALVVALALLSMERYLAALQRGGGGRWLAYVLVTSAAFYSHLIAALLVPVQIFVFFLRPRGERAVRWRPWALSLAVLTLPYLPLLAWQLPLLLRPAETGYAFVPLPQMLYSLLTTYSLGVVWQGAAWAVVPFVALATAAVLAWQDRPLPAASLGLLLCWLLLPILGFFAVTLVRPLFTARYLIFVLPAYLLLLALGLVALWRRSRLLGGLSLILLLLLVGRGLWLQATTPLKADFRGATAYLAERLSAGDLILFQIPYGHHSFDYYYQRRAISPPAGLGFRLHLPAVSGGGGQPYRWAEGLYTNAGLNSAAVDVRMADLVADHDMVWFVATETAMWDARGLVQAWLEEHAVATERAEFERVTVMRYEFR